MLVHNKKLNAAILGPGNIGIDLMYKILKKGKYIDLKLVAGIIEKSKGLELAAKENISISSTGIQSILDRDDIEIVFDATGAKPHSIHAPLLAEAGIVAIDLTPAAIGPQVIPVVNLDSNLNADNINLVTCGGQATIPIVNAINRACSAHYSETVSIIASKSAGPGTRQNIDEFTITTSNAIVTIGGSKKGKAIILLNPADPPITNYNTIYAFSDNIDSKTVLKSIDDMVESVQQYVPGYHLKIPPMIDENRVTVMVEIEGSGDYLPKYSGNLDIMTCAALSVGEKIAQARLN